MKTARQLCIAILVVVAISSLISGYYLISDSTGYSLKLRLDDLKGSPFNDYSIPGWILFITVGCVSVAAIIMSMRHVKHYPLWIMSEGAILIIWILLQINFIRELNFLQLLFGLFGVTLLLLGNLIRKYIKQPTALHHEKIKSPYPNKKSHHHKHRKKH
jgi:nicotinamide riboside transporter PnuC